MKIFIYITFLLFSGLALGQSTFQRIYKDTNLSLMFRSAVEIDSGYVIQGMGLLPASTVLENDVFFFYLDHQGNLKTIYSDHQDSVKKRSGYTGSNLFKKSDSSCMVMYTHIDYAVPICQIKIQEFKFNGEIIKDHSINDIWDSLFFGINDGACTQRISDSIYFLATNGSSFHPDSLNINQGIGVYRLGGDTFNFQYINWLRDRDNKNESYIIKDVDTLQNGNIIILGLANNHGPYFNHGVDILFFELDQNFNLIRTKRYHTNNLQQYPWPGICPTPDTGFIIPHWEGFWVSNNPETPNSIHGGWEYNNKISKFDKDFNLQWNFYIEDGDSMNVPDFAIREVKPTLDNNYVVIAGTAVETDTLFYLAQYDTSVNLVAGNSITKFDLKGEVLWKRYHHIYPYVPNSVWHESNFLWDILPTQDSGYLCVGQYDFHAYALKLNCLGYLENPVANAQFSIQDNYKVQFTNTSAMAGGYTWIFGDGDTLYTDEYTTQLTHVYPNYGTYGLTLIAHGCGGIADTASYTLTALHNTQGDEIVEGDNGIFTIFPNPSQSDGLLNIYLHQDLELVNPVLNIYNLQGKHVQALPLGTKQGTYHYVENLVAGTYLVTLNYKGDLISKKLVVL